MDVYMLCVSRLGSPHDAPEKASLSNGVASHGKIQVKTAPSPRQITIVCYEYSSFYEGCGMTPVVVDALTFGWPGQPPLFARRIVHVACGCGLAGR